MLEHIFRNVNDIRVFDIMTEFPEKDADLLLESGSVDTDDIMSMLDYPEYKRIEVEDSIEHLIKNEILGIKKVKIEGSTGCKACKWTDKFKIPRIGKHKSHKPEEVMIGDIDNYFMKDNNLAKLLIAAVFQHVTLTLEKEIGIKIPVNEIINKKENQGEK